MNSETVFMALGLGPAEIGVLLVLLIFLFGPKRIPEIGESIGKALKSYRKATADEPEPTKDESSIS